MTAGATRGSAELAGNARAARTGRRQGGERLAIAALCAVVLWFYGWTAASAGAQWKFGEEQRDYSNLLIDGWLDGQLHMKVEVPEALLKLQDPYDPAQRPAGLGLHDASFYKGKYFVYFGAAPVVTLMLPFRVLTGMDLPLPIAVLIFVSAGFLASVAVLLEVRRRWFADAPGWVVVAAVAALGWVGSGVVLLRRPDMWELPIGAGYFFAMVTLGCVARSLGAGREGARRWWLAGAGLALGLAVASRPTYLFATPLLLVPLVAWWRGGRGLPWREGLAAAVPLAAIGLAMAGYNQARFGSPTQFGQAYQFSLDYEAKQPHFGTHYVPYNVRQHFFDGARWTREFPFVQAPEHGRAPAGYTMHRGDVYGLLANFPVAWCALLAPLAWWRRTGEERREVVAWVGTTAVLFLGLAALMLSFFSALARYQVEFAPAFMVLAVTGMLAVERWARQAGGRVRRAIVTALVVGGTAWAVMVSGLVTWQIDGMLLERDPAGHERLARRFGWVTVATERVTGVEYGAVELTVGVPADVKGDARLIVCEAGGVETVVFWRGLADGRAGVGYRHGAAPERVSESLELAAGRGGAQRVRVSLGALFPGRLHPLFGDGSEAEGLALRRRVRIEVNGVVALEDYCRMLPAESVRIGKDAGFSGVVETVRRVRMGVAPVPAVAKGDTLRLRVRWPRASRAGPGEPLVVTGRTGAGDFLAVEYPREGEARFKFDHWGTPGMVSEPVAIVPGGEAVVEITMGSLATVMDATRVAGGRHGTLRVRVEGRTVLEGAGEFYVAEPGEVSVGENRIGGTSCGPRFTGEVLASERVGR